MNSMVEVLAAHAAAQPSALFCADPQRSYSYAQGWSWARRIAAALLQRGLKGPVWGRADSGETVTVSFAGPFAGQCVGRSLNRVVVL